MRLPLNPSTILPRHTLFAPHIQKLFLDAHCFEEAESPKRDMPKITHCGFLVRDIHILLDYDGQSKEQSKSRTF
jgi:hypothetical protein